MFRVTRRYRLAASHRLHAEALSEEENRQTFGKCNNPFGHGHNYIVEVSARGPLDERTGRAIDPAKLDTLVTREIIAPLDHRNLNLDVDWFAGAVPTTENLTSEIQRRLSDSWESTFPGEWPKLEKIRILETPRNIFETESHEIK